MLSPVITIAVKVMFNSTEYSGAEADGIIPVTVVATGTASIPYTVIITPLESDPRSARAEVDYANEAISVIFNPGETEKTVDVVINPDCLREGSEFFNLSLSTSSAASLLGVCLGDPSEAVAEIEDTDSKCICFTTSITIHIFVFVTRYYKSTHPHTHLLFRSMCLDFEYLIGSDIFNKLCIEIKISNSIRLHFSAAIQSSTLYTCNTG